MVEYLQLNIDRLLLDQDNSRLGFVNSQSEALEAIIHLSDGHFRNLMLSIKENVLDLGDNLYVIDAEYDDDFLVLGGNRHFSALMGVLRNSKSHTSHENESATLKNNLSLLVLKLTHSDHFLSPPQKRDEFRNRPLMVLNNPSDLIGTQLPETVKKSPARVAVGFNHNEVEPIRCVKFENRSEAVTSFSNPENRRTVYGTDNPVEEMV